MNESAKTKAQLMEELNALRKRVAETENPSKPLTSGPRRRFRGAGSGSVP